MAFFRFPRFGARSAQSPPPPATPPSAAVLAEPEPLVRAFIADYRAWNDDMMARFGGEPDTLPEGYWDTVGSEYRALLDRYARPGHRGRLETFGTDATHHPDFSTILSVRVDGDAAVVRTRRTTRYGFADEYEFHLSRGDGRWFLEEVYYVGEDGSLLPGL